MIDIIILIIGFSGFSLASYFDLKYTEFPDWLPYGMIALFVPSRAIHYVFTADAGQFFLSMVSGAVFLGIGLLFYYAKQWGDGDAWLMGCLGFIAPNSFIRLMPPAQPYISLLINFFVVSLAYIIIYSIVLGARNNDVRKAFTGSVRRGRRLVYASFITAIVYIVFVSYMISIHALDAGRFYLASILPAIIFSTGLFFRYATIVEAKIFRKRVGIKDLKEGDVIFNGKWKGLTKQGIRGLKGRRFVWVKEGVRFAPAFLITLAASVLLGGFFV